MIVWRFDSPRLARALAAAGLVAGTFLTAGTDGCVVHEDKCTRHGECPKGFCAAAGFCSRECEVDSDCPCGSVCAGACGICTRLDLSGPATCFAFKRGLSTEEMLGVCRADIDHLRARAASGGAMASREAGDDAETCRLEPVSLPVCKDSPPIEAGTEAQAEPEEPDGSESGADDPPGDESDSAVGSDGGDGSSAPTDGGEAGGDR